mmetsp:Transcript_5587/g.11076  ORF Transcript_5587/g.11076 Transcript_5587/m.11076 type:complete len:80 (-) Transcript_5587:1058-1297(-)
MFFSQRPAHLFALCFQEQLFIEKNFQKIRQRTVISPPPRTYRKGAYRQTQIERVKQTNKQTCFVVFRLHKLTAGTRRTN